MSAGDKDVILVVMHHTRDPKNATSMRTWEDLSKVVLHVSISYHETMGGLLNCQENNAAASEIQKKLLEYGIVTSKEKANSGSFFGLGKYLYQM